MVEAQRALSRYESHVSAGIITKVEMIMLQKTQRFQLRISFKNTIEANGLTLGNLGELEHQVGGKDGKIIFSAHPAENSGRESTVKYDPLGWRRTTTTIRHCGHMKRLRSRQSSPA